MLGTVWNVVMVKCYCLKCFMQVCFLIGGSEIETGPDGDKDWYLAGTSSLKQSRVISNHS